MEVDCHIPREYWKMLGHIPRQYEKQWKRLLSRVTEGSRGQEQGSHSFTDQKIQDFPGPP